MAMMLGELLNGLEGVVGVAGPREVSVARVSEDSRRVEAGDLFVARRGTTTSGAQYAADAVGRGAVAVVSEEALELSGVTCAQVASAPRALGYLAQKMVGNPAADMTVLAVTGTKGKTTVTYLLRSILRAAGQRCGLVGTVELDDGVRVVPSDMTTPGPIELANLMTRMRVNGVRHCVMEVSSHALHQQRVAGVSFAVGMFTNLTGDHLDYHGTMDAYAAAKALLFSGLYRPATAVINVDDLWADRMVADTPANVVRYGLHGACDWAAEIGAMTSSGTHLKLRGPGRTEADFASPLVGRHNVYNTLCAAAAATAIGVPLTAVMDGLGEMAGVPGRLERVTAPSDRFQVFVDYAHTHDALENVLLALRGTMDRTGDRTGDRRGDCQGRLICVFGCGGDRDRTKRPKMGAIAERLADRVIVTSDNPRTEDPGRIIEEVMAGVSAAGRGHVQVEPDRREAIRMAIAQAESGDVVLIAGKGHEDYQIVGSEKRHFDDREEAMAALEGGRV